MNKLETNERHHKWHRSSTDNSSTSAWIQLFVNGSQLNYSKFNSYWARSVRRVKK